MILDPKAVKATDIKLVLLTLKTLLASVAISQLLVHIYTGKSTRLAFLPAEFTTRRPLFTITGHLLLSALQFSVNADPLSSAKLCPNARTMGRFGAKEKKVHLINHESPH